MPVTLVKVSTTDSVDDPTLVTGIINAVPTLTVAVRNTTGDTINTFVLVPGTGLTAEWQIGTPISLANDAQVNIVLTFDDSIVRDNFSTTFQVTSSGGSPTMNLTLTVTQGGRTRIRNRRR